MAIRLLQRLIDALLGLDGGHVLNGDSVNETPPAEIAAELRTIVDQLKMEASDMGNGQVNYRVLKDSQTYRNYKKVAEGLRHFDLAALQTREERLAFWINLYNSLIIDAVISFGIEKTIWEAGRGFFRKAAYDIGSVRYSADDIEHGILRGNCPHPVLRLRQFTRGDPRIRHAVVPMDPRIHSALVCASRSCPLITVYHASEIEEELETAANTFINGGGVIVEPKLNRVSLSRIFSWYQKDFGDRTGTLEFSVAHLREGPEKDYLRENIGKVRLSYQKYDWSLNHY